MAVVPGQPSGIIMEKLEVRLFLDPQEIEKVDKMIKQGYGGTRSDVVRRIVIEHFLIDKKLKDHEERIKKLEGPWRP